jgi:hypothetical protein
MDGLKGPQEMMKGRKAHDHAGYISTSPTINGEVDTGMIEIGSRTYSSGFFFFLY